MAIDQLTKARIMDAINIEEVVGDYVSLKRRGANLWGVCPFHNEKTPSFSVSPSKGIFKCFGCGVGGDAVTFLMKRENCSYPDALRMLAKRYNIEIVETQETDEDRMALQEREGIFQVNDWAKKYFHDILFNNQEGRAVGLSYLHSRGFSDETIETFGLGYALDSWDALSKAATATQVGYSSELLVKSKVCGTKENGQLYDFFRNRVIFPWYNITGKVVAFSGRKLDASTKGVNQKYINTAENAVYTKGHELYGLFQAKEHIAKQKCVYLVEGQTDVISMHQCGIKNVVAGSGTALTDNQAHILKRLTDSVIMLYDGDAAGIHAASVNLLTLVKNGLYVEMATFPDGEDPDSFARGHSAEEFLQFIEEEKQDAILYFIERWRYEAGANPKKRSDALHNLFDYVGTVSDNILYSDYVDALAKRFDKTKGEIYRGLRDHFRKEQPQEQQREEFTPTPQALDRDVLCELNILYYLLRHGNDDVIVKQDSGEEVTMSVSVYLYALMDYYQLNFSADAHRIILQEAFDKYQEGVDVYEYFVHHENPAVQAVAVGIFMDRYKLSKIYQRDVQEEALKQQQELSNSARKRLKVLQEQKTIETAHEMQAAVLQSVNVYRFALVLKRLKEISNQLEDKNLSQEESSALLLEYNQQISAKIEIAKELDQVII